MTLTIVPVERVPLETLALHPAADRVPMAGASDLAVLRRSLQEHGQQDPIDINEKGQILDGRTRWTLLRQLGVPTVEVRRVDVPEDEQTHYIVDRALARRHLTAEQKRALNGLLRETVMEVAVHPVTGEEVSIGHGQSKRAEVLGVGRATVMRWDEEEADVPNEASAPTHQRVGPRIEPIQKPRPQPKSNGRAHRGQKPVERRRHAPPWIRHFAQWCRRVARAEDRKLLLRLDAELHDALHQLHIECDH
ncbi:MAG: ParB/RepB/Spo0J family partition protein [Chloroflexi bacterium]|nr:ParB/RepB/Spo0J family partition protein [Chloroflexota bacterium]